MPGYIKEIFESIQGEGLFVGEKEIFIRFSGCNLNCEYCDTDWNSQNAVALNEQELFDIIRKFNADTISLTGGEPLLQADFIFSFLKKYSKFLNKYIYLETNGTLYNELAKIIDCIDIIGMDIKLFSSTKEENRFEDNEKFLTIAGKKAFIKIVFNEDITEDEIIKTANLGIKFDVPIILQPKMPLDTEVPYIEIYNKFYNIYKNVRLIPQTHKFLNIK